MTAPNERGWNLLALLLNAPLCGVVKRQRRRPLVLHAITMEQVGDGWQGGDFRKRQARFVSACGREGIAAFGIEGDPLLWPPRVRGLPPSLTRCRECHLATGRRRPRSWFEFVKKEAAGA